MAGRNVNLGLHLAPSVSSRTPFSAWFLAAITAVCGGLAALDIRACIGVGVLLFVAWIVSRTVTLPSRGLHLALWIMPWYPLVRGAIWAYYPNLPLFASRFWLEIILAAMLAGILLRMIVRRERYPLNRHDIPVLLLLLSGCYGLVLTLLEHAYANLVFGVYYSLTPLLAYLVVRLSGTTANDARAVFRTLLITFTLLALASFADYIIKPDLTLRISMANRAAFFAGDISAAREFVTTIYLRMTSLLLEEDVWGSMCALLSLLCIARMTMGRASGLVKVVFVLSLLGLVMSMARGALGGWAAGVAILALFHRGRRLRVVLLVAALIGIGAATYVGLRVDPRIRNMEDRMRDRAPGEKGVGLDKGRQVQYEQGISTFTSTPSGIGVGRSGFAAIYLKNGPPLVTDGFYLHIAVEQGIPGLILWAVALPGMWWVLWRRAWSVPDGEMRSLGMGLLAAFTGLCVHALVANVFDYYATPATFFILTALFLSATTRYANGTPSLPASAPTLPARPRKAITA